jgi:protein SCO1/2
LHPRLLVALVLVSVFALGAVVLAGGDGEDNGGGRASAGPATRFEGATFPEGVRAPDFELTDQDGRRLSMRGLRGQPVLVTFLYTTCDETCPGQAQLVKGALDELGHDLPAVAVAVDPPRDTPERARAFLAEQRMTGRLSFALGSREELRPVWRGFAIQPQSVREEHQARFTLVDERGFQRVGFPLGQATPERLAHDLRVLEGGS